MRSSSVLLAFIAVGRSEMRCVFPTRRDVRCCVASLSRHPRNIDEAENCSMCVGTSRGLDSLSFGRLEAEFAD